MTSYNLNLEFLINKFFKFLIDKTKFSIGAILSLLYKKVQKINKY